MQIVVTQPPIIKNISGKIIFLAGPIQGAADWQSQAIAIFEKLDNSITIANPRKEYIDDSFVYEKQVDWETANLRAASEQGVILFWLAREQTHNCERAYGQTTRFELAEWKIRHERDGVKLVIGIDEGFSNARYIRRRIGQDCPDIHIKDTLRETCEEAVRVLKDS